MKKVLIITYYWPPSGGGGVQRWLKMVKHLPTYGWEPVVLAPENPDYPLIDESLTADIPENLEVVKVPIIEPRRFYQFLQKKKTGKDSGPSADELFFVDKAKLSFKSKMLLWARANLLIPDARRFWVKPASRFVKKYIKENQVDAIITSGPPHSLHLIGLKVHRDTGLPWVADFRDPWTQIEFFERMPLSDTSRRKHERYEKAVMTEANAVLAVADHWVKVFSGIGAKNVHLVTNGFDPADFPDESAPLDTTFNLGHFGTFAGDRNPQPLWQALKQLADASSEFKKDLRIHLAGKVDPQIFTSIKEEGLEEHLEFFGYVSHQRAVELMMNSGVLLLLINDSQANAPGRMTGKIFEYLASRRPILCVGPEDCDPAVVLKQTEAGLTVAPDDVEKLKETIAAWYADFQENKLHVSASGYMKYSRKTLSEKVAGVLDGVV
ncbi:MAG: glycosyltransferase family 4 protein [Bacteroidia bacterium]